MIETFRVASATDIAAPSHGSSSPTAALPSVEATSAFVVPFTRNTAAPRPGPTTVSAPTVESYWWNTSWREASPAEPMSPSRTAPGSIPRSGRRSAGSAGAPGRWRAAAMDRRRTDPLMDDGVAGERSGRDPGDLARARSRPPGVVDPALDHGDVAVVGDPADDGDRQVPVLAHGTDLGPPLGTDDRAHPLLRLGDHHLERLRDPARGVGSHRGRRACPVPARSAVSDVAHVMPPAPRSWRPSTSPRSISSRLASISSFSANGSPTWTDGRFDTSASVKVELGEDGCATDAVPTRGRPEQDDEVARSRRSRERQKPLLEETDGHDVDERIALVARVEDELATDRRHADAVAVTADPAHDAIDEVPRPRIGRVAETESVEDRDRPCAHREDVAEDPADAGRGTLVWLDGGRVVVRLDLERDRESVADRDDAGVLARAGNDALAGRRKRPQQRLR